MGAFGLLLALLAAMALLWATARWLLPRWRAMRREIRRVCTSGHVPDPPTPAALRTMRRIAGLAVWLQVGRVEVRGLDHLLGGGARLVTPNHGHYLDPFVLGLVFPERMRCMAAHGLMSAVGGFAALPLARWGAFCTDLRTGRGGPAIRAAVRLLQSGQNVVLFPEGWANVDGSVRPFKRGAVSIARMATARADGGISIVPVHLRYGAYPGRWINELPTHLQYLVMLLGAPIYRRGVRIEVGRPLTLADLPESSTAASDALRAAVLALDPQTSPSASVARRVPGRDGA